MRPGVRERVQRVSAVVWWSLAVGAGLCLLAGVFVWHERTSQYDAGYEYGEHTKIISVHVFDGDPPAGDRGSYAALAEQECAEHSADDDVGNATAKWLEGCVDAVLRR